MKKVYVLGAALFAAFAALSVGSASFADHCPSYGNCDHPGDSVPSTDDTIPNTDPTTSSTTTTVEVTTTSAATTTTQAAVTTAESTTTSTSTTTTVDASGVTVSTDEVGQAAPTTAPRVGSDGLLPNTGSDIAMPLILGGLAAGTGAATLLVRRRSNAS
jgi:LPXTG-motif cell wall-anchored protein